MYAQHQAQTLIIYFKSKIKPVLNILQDIKSFDTGFFRAGKKIEEDWSIHEKKGKYLQKESCVFLLNKT